MKSVFQSSPPQPMLPTFSGTLMVPRSFPLRADHPDAAGTRDIDVAELIWTFMPRQEYPLPAHPGHIFEKHPAIRQCPVLLNVENTDVGPCAVIDIEFRSIR